MRGTEGSHGLVSREQLADLLELDEVLVGEGWYNSAGPGGTMDKTRLWGEIALLFHRSEMPTADGPPTLALTFPYRGMEVRSGFDERIGARGAHEITVIDSCDEKVVAPQAGFLWTSVVTPVA